MKITWLPQEHLQTPGRLGLTCSPGSGSAHRDEDLDALKEEGVQHIVCLQQAWELNFLEPPENITARREAVQLRGMTFIHAPIEDFHAPDLSLARKLTRLILAGLQRGDDMIVHCWAGLGRAGTIAACVLVEQGLSADGAVALVRWVRPGAIQSEEQSLLIAEFAQKVTRE